MLKFATWNHIATTLCNAEYRRIQDFQFSRSVSFNLKVLRYFSKVTLHCKWTLPNRSGQNIWSAHEASSFQMENRKELPRRTQRAQDSSTWIIQGRLSSYQHDTYQSIESNDWIPIWLQKFNEHCLLNIVILLSADDIPFIEFTVLPESTRIQAMMSE